MPVYCRVDNLFFAELGGERALEMGRRKCCAGSSRGAADSCGGGSKQPESVQVSVGSWC